MSWINVRAGDGTEGRSTKEILEERGTKIVSWYLDEVRKAGKSNDQLDDAMISQMQMLHDSANSHNLSLMVAANSEDDIDKIHATEESNPEHRRTSFQLLIGDILRLGPHRIKRPPKPKEVPNV
jgi:hypothetical protein